MLALSLQSFISTIVLILILRPIALRYGLTDKPCARKNHTGEIPLIGGISIYLSLLLLFYWIPTEYCWYLITATIIVSCGVIDDFKHLSIKIRLSVEVMATVIMIKWGGMEITSLGNLFGLGNIELGSFSFIVTIFAVVGGINAFNMTDGIDGATGGLSLLIMGLILLLATHIPQITTICMLFVPALIGFLLFNVRIFGREKASIFLGDAGSMLLGFTICYLVILISQGEERIISPATVLWIIALPLLDAVCIMLRRIGKGKSVFAPDREHLHHILRLAGYSTEQTINIILLIALTLGSFGIIGERLFELPEWLMFALFMGLFFLYYSAMSHAWKVMKVARQLHAK